MLIRSLLLMALLLPLPALAQVRWMAGKDYIVIPNGVPAEIHPGKIEVAEVFSYGCIFCNRARGEIAKLQAALPADAYMTYVHASFAPAEAWPMFQRAWYTALALRIGAATHDQMFAAVWDTHEIPLLDAAGGIRKPLPTIKDAARFYARAAKVKEADFLKMANSPVIDAHMERADTQIAAWRIPGTPAVVVNGRYLIEGKALAANWNDSRALVLYLVGQERQRLARLQQAPTPAPTPAKKP